MAEIDVLQAKVNGILSARGQALAEPGLAAAGDEEPEVFSEFDSAQRDRGIELASRLMRIASEVGGDAGIAAALEEADRAERTERVAGLVQYAVKLFVTHHPEARAKLRLKPLEKRQPNLVRPSRAAALEGEAELAAVGGGGATPPEDRIDYWREDPLLNDHHEHWHLVYPAGGRPSAGGGRELGDRHGELFAYMHQQMLARYDAERLSLGLPRVVRFDDYRAGIPQGYDPGGLRFWTGRQWVLFRARPADAQISDLDPQTTVESLEISRDNLLNAVGTGVFDVDGEQTPVAIDNLGNTSEANALSLDSAGATYGDHHNTGHVHFAYFDGNNRPGVMISTATAIRDVIFYRWHKQVDNIYQEFQEAQEPNDFSDAPPVRIRKETGEDGRAKSLDIILCRKDGLPATFDGHTLGAEAFGGDNWDMDFAAASVPLGSGELVSTTDELLTEMQKRTIELVDRFGNTVEEEIDFLSHDDYYYFLRIENLSDQPRKLTARIFLAPERDENDEGEVWTDRTSWIELDKFIVQIQAGERAVVYRPAQLASVVRKPAIRPEDLTPGEDTSPKTNQQAWCDCGWPYTLLLPRGTAEGKEFRLFVMLSDGSDLNQPASEHCTSISYCGLQDKEYPDTRLMGYPFDRPFPQGIGATVEPLDNMAMRTIRIRCKNG
jgi:tyrosinase